LTRRWKNVPACLGTDGDWNDDDVLLNTVES
jgi:hypothetical protein